MSTNLLHHAPTSMLDNFQKGMDRIVPEWRRPPLQEIGDDFISVNLGAGKKEISGALPLDVEHGWHAGERMPFEDGTVSAFYAYHFMEHLNKDEIMSVLREVERCLLPMGVMNIVVPHRLSQMAYQDLDHKSWWTETTFRNLFANPYYDGTMPRDWKLVEASTIVMGLVERNLALVTQLVKPG